MSPFDGLPQDVVKILVYHAIFAMKQSFCAVCGSISIGRVNLSDNIGFGWMILCSVQGV